MTGRILLALALLLALGVTLRLRRYAKLLGDEQLMLLARALPALKRGASERMDEPIASDADARIVRTDAGVALVYTMNREGEELVHHTSLSVPGAGVAQGALETLLVWVVHLLDWPLEGVRVERGASAFHAEWVASPDQHAAFMARSVVEVTDANVLPLRRSAMDARDRLRTQLG